MNDSASGDAYGDTTPGSAVDQPVLRQTVTGWMALSPPTMGLRFAVDGATRDEAAQRWHESLAYWRALQELPEPLPVPDGAR